MQSLCSLPCIPPPTLALARPFEDALQTPINHIGSHPDKLDRLAGMIGAMPDLDSMIDEVLMALSQWSRGDNPKIFSIFVLDMCGDSACVAVAVALYHAIIMWQWFARVHGAEGMLGTMVHFSEFHWGDFSCAGECLLCAEMTDPRRRAAGPIAEIAERFCARARFASAS